MIDYRVAFYIILILCVLTWIAFIIFYFYNRLNKSNINIEQYLLLLNILDNRIYEYRKLYEIYKQKLNKQYQINNPKVTFNKSEYQKNLQVYLLTLIQQLLDEFSKESKIKLLHIFSEDGIVRYLTDKIVE